MLAVKASIFHALRAVHSEHLQEYQMTYSFIHMERRLIKQGQMPLHLGQSGGNR